MRNKKILILIFVLGFLSIFGIKYSDSETDKDKEIINGLSFVAPPSKFVKNPMKEIKAISANWISVIPIAYTQLGKTQVHYNNRDWQWWGERPEGVKETIKLAKEAGLHIMLKPQVYVPGSWPGGLDFEDDLLWEKWEKSYECYIFEMLKIAVDYDVELFCVGTEFKVSSKTREAFWRNLIKEIRVKYKGKLTYAANWDEYKYINFWNELDYIGIDAYFPLIEQKKPSLSALTMAWNPWLNEISEVQKIYHKPVIFTEYGYLSVDGCAGKTWELEPKVKSLNVNEGAQAVALDALHQVFRQEDFWEGGFLWKWFPNGKGHEGYVEKDYTPQGKKAVSVLKSWFE